LRPKIVLLPQDEASLSVAALREWADVTTASTPAEAVRLLKGGAQGVVERGVSAARETPNEAEILNLLSDGVAVLDSSLRFLWHNRALAELAGGKPLDRLTTSLAFPASLAPPADAAAPATPIRARYGFAGRHLETTLRQIPGKDDRPRLWLCTARDVTAEVGWQEKLIAIHRAGRELARLTPDELARMSTAERIDLLKANIIQYSQQVLHFRNLEIRLCDPFTKKLTVLLSEGIAEGVKTPLAASVVDNGVTGYVAATGIGYVCHDVARDPHYLPGAPNARSSLTVPILDHETVVGTFNVESDQPNHFNDSDREFLEVFAREIAVALNNLELLSAEKRFGRAATVEAILNEVGLPADAIVADTIRVLDSLRNPEEADPDAAKESLRQILYNARSIKAAIHRAGRSDSAVVGSPAAAAIFTGKKVLVVDSDPTIRRSAHRLLGQLGCEVDTAGNGREAVGLVRSLTYDVVVADIRLPDLNGFELYNRIREHAPNAAVVLMTGFGYDSTHSLVKARQAGLRAVLYKPFRMDRLIEALEDALQMRPDREPIRARPSSQGERQAIL
jgi:CheY-like chemotaxis protein